MHTRFRYTSAAALALLLVSAFPARAELDTRWTGVIQADAVRFEPPEQSTPRYEQDLRRARLALVLRRGNSKLVVDRDFHHRSWADIALDLTPAKGHGIRLGHFRPAFGLEELDSSRRTLLMERALINVMAPGRRWGTSWDIQQGSWALTANLFGDRIDGSQRGNGVGLRLVRGEQFAEQQALHLGVAAQHEHVDGPQRLSSTPGSRLCDYRPLSTGALHQLSTIRRTGLEGLYTHGPFSVQGESMTWQGRQASGSTRLHGHTLQAGWWLTGEHRGYRNGQLLPVQANNGRHAWQLGLRSEHLSLHQHGLPEQRQSDLTLGLSAYIGTHWRLSAELVDGRVRNTTMDSRFRVLQTRLQFGF